MTAYATTQTREAPFNRMGIELDPGTSLPDAMLEGRMLGWNVRKSPALTIVGPHDSEDDNAFTVQEVPNKFSIIRDDVRNPGQYNVIGNDVTADYTEVQNEQVAEFAQDVLDISGGDLMVQSIGSYKGGSQCFVNLQRPEGVLIGGDDRIDEFILMHWGHDGGTAITLQSGAIRLWCTNMIDGMLGDQTAPRFKVRHVGSAHEGRVAEARQALKVMADGRSALEAEIERWAAKRVSEKVWGEIVEQLLPSPHEPGIAQVQVTRRLTDRETLQSLWKNDPQHGNAWGAIGAWTEMGDWFGAQTDPDRRAIAQVTSPDLAARRRAGARVIAERAGLILAA